MYALIVFLVAVSRLKKGSFKNWKTISGCPRIIICVLIYFPVNGNKTGNLYAVSAPPLADASRKKYVFIEKKSIGDQIFFGLYIFLNA